MMTVFSGVLLGLAIVDVLFAVVQLTFLSGMKLIVYDWKPTTAWLYVVGPSVVVLVLATMSLNLTPIFVGFGYLSLAIVMLFQAAATEPILQRQRERNEALRQRNRVMNHR